MRKWLVGLLALACAAATSFAEGTATLPLEVKLTDKSTAWTSLPGFTAQGLGSIYANGNAKFDTTGDWMMVQFDSDPGELTFDVTGNTASGGEGTISFLVEESADGETWDPVDNLTDIATGTASKGPYTLAAASRYVRWTYANKVAMNIGLNNIGITSGGPAEFSVTFNKENMFKVALGEASSVTAIPKNGVEPYTFAWESDTPELNGGTTDTLEIPATLAEGDYTVLCQVTDDNGEGDVINALIGFTVAAVPVITGDNFELVSSSDELQDGMRVLVTDVTHAFAMSSVATGSALASVDVTETDGVITASDESIIWTLVEDSDGNFALQNGEQYVGWPSGNAAKMQADSFANKISVAEGVATITAASDTTRNLKYNKSSPRFAYYTSAQTDLALFKEAGEAGLSVTLDKANGFTVDLGSPDSITATAKNGVEPYTYAWTSDTPDLNGTGETLAIPATLAEGDYTVQVEVTDAESNKASKQIYFSVVAPAVMYPVTIADGIENGEITVDKTEAAEGETVTVTATPAEGFALEAITVNGIAISATTFPMPAEAVEVGATFTEVKDYAELPFVAEDTPYSGPWKGATVDGLTSKGLGTDYGDGAAKLDTTGDWLQVKFVGTPGTLSYGIKGNSVSADNPSTFLVQESADGETWSTLATYVSGDNLGDKAEASHELSASSQFVRFFYETKGAGNVGIYDVYITSGGPAVFSITLDPAKDFEVEQNAEAFVTAIPKHAAEGVVGYAWWIDGTPVDTAGEVLALATAELGPHKVTCEATDAAGAKADAHVIYTVVAPAVKYAVNVAIGILNGGVTADKEQAEEGELVTLTASADAGYKLGTFLLDGEAITGNTFNMPAHDVLVSAEFIVKPVVAGFTKITSLDELTEGEYVITGAKAGESEYAMLAEIAGTSTKYIPRRDTAVEIEDDVVTDAEDSIIWTLAQGENGWTIYNAAETAGYVGYVASGKNSAGYEAEPSEKSSWTISVGEDGLFALVNVADNTRNLRYNTGSGQERFACYAPNSSGNLTGVALAFYKGASGPATFSISLSPAKYFEVEVGEEASITATAKNAEGDVHYKWTVGGEPAGGDSAVLGLDTTAATDELEVVCTATDGTDAIATAKVSYKVVTPAVKYPITIAEGIENGEIAVDKTEAAEEETVTVTATPAEGYALDKIFVNGVAISATTFPMPAEAVVVGATFAEVKDYAELPFVAEDTPYSGPWKGATVDGLTSKGLGDDYKDGSAKLDSANDWIQVKFVGTPGSLSFGIKGNSLSEEKPSTFLVQESADGTEWSTLETYTTGDKLTGERLDQTLELSATSQFVRFFYETKGAGNVGIYDVYISAGGPAVFSVKLDPASDFSVEKDAAASIKATPKNAEGAVSYAWKIDGTPVDALGDELVLDTSVVGGPHEVTCDATDGSGATATATVSYTVTEPGPQPGEPAVVIDGPASGVVGTELSCTVTAINLEDTSVYFEGNYGAPEGSTLTTEGIVFEDGVCTFTPDIAGDYWIEFAAYDGDTPITGTWTVTVTAGPGPQPSEAGITKMTIASGKMTIEFFGEGAQVLLSDDMETWTPVDGAISPFSFDMNEAGKKYIGVR